MNKPDKKKRKNKGIRAQLVNITQKKRSCQMAKRLPDREERGKACIEVNRNKHKKYKIYAIQQGIKLKELAELALDAYTSKGK